MRWYEPCDNPSAVASKYSDPSALDRLMITELFMGNGTLRVFGDLTHPPDNCAQADVARLGLALWDVVDLAAAGIPVGTLSKLNLRGP